MLKQYNAELSKSFGAVSVEDLLVRFKRVRAHSLAIVAPLSVEDCAAQSMPDASPAKWHLAHTTWFFETFVLGLYEVGFTPFDPAFRVLFNSYYNSIGDKFSRPHRGLLTRPSFDAVSSYRQNVNTRVEVLLSGHCSQAMLETIELGLQHEQQHQELIVTDVKHLLSHNPLYPSYGLPLDQQKITQDESWIAFEGGIIEVGHNGEGFCFDSETPRHKQYINDFKLAASLVTNADYREFIMAGGYEEPAYWLSDGWAWVQAERVKHPLYWRRDEQGNWLEYTLSGLGKLCDAQAVTHVSYYEAAAYAQWVGARLPTEAEWEHAAQENAGCRDMFGAVWQWTSSSYAPYPGFAAAPGAVGEYNGKFMVNQYVLRGSSCATPEAHSRPSYRNFFPASARWQFNGIRLAR